MSLKKETLYRVSLDISSRGSQQVTLTLRDVPAPYTGYISSTEPISETVRHLSFLGKSPADAAPVGLFLNMNGFTTLTLDNIKVEEVRGALPPGAPPVPGNLLPNAGFEVGGDGWFTRGPVEFVSAPDAAEGRRVAVMHGGSGQDILSSTFFGLSFASDYLVQARVRAISPSASVSLNIGGQDAEVTAEKGDGWKILSLRFRPAMSKGKIVPFLNASLGLECHGEGAAAQRDAVSVQAVGAGVDGVPFQPIQPLEIGLRTDAPEGTLIVGETATATALSSAPLREAALEIRDENETLFRRMPLHFRDRQAALPLPPLPPGYWHLSVTAPNALPGETFLAVIPRQPSLPAADWFYGTHIIDDPVMRQTCWKLGLHWDRLHDAGQTLKWPSVQPDNPGQWLWHDEETAHRRTAEHERGQIDTFEVLNEANFGMTAAQYLAVLKTASAGLRAGNPNAVIVAPAVGGFIDDAWLRDVIRGGAGKYCDVISYHGYGLDTWAALGGPDALRRGVTSLRGDLADAGTPGLPIWDTECGVSGIQSRFTKFSLPGWGAGAKETARMFAKSAACAKAGGLGRIFYYAAFQPTVASETDPNVFGFGDVNGVLKMPFQALGVAISLLEGREFTGEAAAEKAKGIIHLTFRGRGARVQMFWRTSGVSTLRVPAGTSRIVSLWGRDLPRGKTLTLTEDPIYLVSAG